MRRYIVVVLLCVSGIIVSANTGSNGEVVYLQGDVLINGVEVEFGQVVPKGARVQTGPGAAIEISFLSKNIFRLGENTVAVITIDKDVRDVELRTGFFTAVLERLQTIGGRDSDQFRLRTPTAVGGVRGTSFFSRVIDNNTTYICTCNGTVNIEDHLEHHEMTVTAGEHEAYLFVKGANEQVTSMRTAVIDHDNDDINALARKVDVIVPWGRVQRK